MRKFIIQRDRQQTTCHLQRERTEIETPVENNANAIRTEHLIRRILGLTQTDGHNHGGYKKRHITYPYILPILK